MKLDLTTRLIRFIGNVLSVYADHFIMDMGVRRIYPMDNLKSDENFGTGIVGASICSGVCSAYLIKIKTDLDPAYSYIVIESSNIEECKRNHLQSLGDTLFANKQGVFDFQLFRDDTAHECMLVVKINATFHDEWLQKIGTINLPDDIFLKVYSSQDPLIRLK